jgi:hypothetical protein
MYSGRPNPRWATSPQEDAVLEGILANLREATRVEQPLGGLGYRGFRLTDEKRETVVRGQVVDVQTASGSAHLHDPGKVLETTLVDFANHHLDPRDREFLNSFIS